MPEVKNKKRIALPCGFFTAIMLLLTVLVCMTQAWGPMGGHLAIAGMFLGCFALAVLILRREGAGRDVLPVLLALAALALFLRSSCMDAVSGDYKDFLLPWAKHFRDNGGFAALSEPVGNYNVIYLYFIALISYIDIPDLYLYKMLSVLFDIILAWGCLRVVRAVRGDDKSGLMSYAAFSIALLVPTVFLNSSWWAQCDSVYVAFCVHAVADLITGKNKRSLVFMALAFSIKLQAVFVLPLWGVAWLAGRVKFRELFVFPAAYLMTIVPALIAGRSLGSILGVYFLQMQYYPILTLNAPSMFMFLPEDVAEQYHGVGVMCGIAAAFTFVLILLYAGYRLRDRLDGKLLFRCAVLLSVGVPYLLPQMHERYFYLADIMLVCLACADMKYIFPAALSCMASFRMYGIYLFGEYEPLWYFPSKYASHVLFGAIPETAAFLFVAAFFARDVFRTLNRDSDDIRS